MTLATSGRPPEQRMNVEWSHIESTIRQRQEMIAARWYAAVSPTSFTPRGRDEVRQRFTQLTARIVGVLLADQDDPATARALGAELAALHYLQPAALGRTLDVLGKELVTGLSPRRASAIHARLVAVLGAVAEGFFAQARAMILDEQEETRAALLTARQRAEEQLRREERLRTREQATRAAVEAERDRLQQILDLLPAAVLIADTGGHYILSNAAAVTIIGANIVGQSMPAIDHDISTAYGLRLPDGTPYPADDMPLARAIMRGEETHGEQMIIRNSQSGQDVPLLVNGAPLHDRDGTPIGAVTVFQDISTLKDLEHTREMFLSAVSHDLKSPLTSIRGLAQVLQRQVSELEPPRGERMTRSLNTILRSTASMMRLLEDLQDVTRLQLGQALEIDREPADLVAIVQAVAERHQVIASHQIIVEAGPAPLMALIDTGRIERVVTNLLTNAIKYSPEGGEVTIALTRQDDDGAWAVLAVRDKGVGIPATDLPHIFELFRRGGNVVGRIMGTGVGLASVHEIVRQHGGTLAVESQEGLGSAFTVRLPLGADAPD